MDNTVHYSRWIDCHYSPEEDGWYAHDYQRDVSTGLYDTDAQLLEALDRGTATWEA